MTGLEELAYELRQARKVKPIIAVVDCLAASAGYWLASQANEIVITPSGMVGSVGVFWLHVDESQLLANVGIKPTYVHAGRYKVEGNPAEPLTDDALRHFQADVNAVHATFVADIVKGRGRGLTVDRVKKEFGEGRLVTAAEAIRRGMVDQLFPATDAAYTYAMNWSNDRQRQADLDYVKMAIRIAELRG